MIRASSALTPVAVLTSVVLLVACGGTQFADQPFTAVARLSGVVCGSEMVGTAVVIRDELLVTAAHNVAGADGPMTITFSDATTHQAVVVGFDIHRDIAFLSTPGMHRLPIRMANPQEGATGKILRLRGPIAEEAVQYSRAEIVTAVGHDIFDDRSDVRRANLRLEAVIGAGFSGAPVLDSDGSLTAMVNTRSRQSALIYAVMTSEIRAAYAETDVAVVVETNRCP